MAENAGKRLFTEDFKFELGEVDVKRFRGTSKMDVAKRISGGLNCATCHQPPEFDIDPATLNNGIIGVAGTLNNIDLTNTRAPSLRDIVNPNGDLNGPLMHNGGITSLEALVEHYNLIDIDPLNTNLDPRLGGPGGNLQLTTTEKEDLINFLKTLTGMAVYSDEKWSDPFDENGDIDVVPMLTAHVYSEENKQHLLIYPNPAQDVLHLKGIGENVTIKIFDTSGKLVLIETDLQGNSINIQKLKSGVYHLQVAGVVAQYSKFIKQ